MQNRVAKSITVLKLLQRRAVVAGLGVVACFAGMSPVAADQYRSQQRELPNAPAANSAVDVQQLLDKTTEPYPRALLLRDLAARAASQNDLSTAAKLLREAVQLNVLAGPAQDEMRRQLSQLSAAQVGAGAGSLAALEAQVRADPRPGPDLLAALGAAYLAAKRPADAIAPLQKAIAGVAVAEPTWRRVLAASFLATGREREAAPLLEQLLKENPASAEDWRRYAAVLQRGNDPERTLAVLEVANRVGALGPEERQRYIALAAQQGLPFRAASALQAWMDSSALPASTENYRMLAALWTQARESALALHALDQVRQRADTADIEQQIGQLQLERGDAQAALKAFEHAMGEGGKSGTVLLNLAAAALQSGDRQRAEQAYRAASEIPAVKKFAEPWLNLLQSAQGALPANGQSNAPVNAQAASALAQAAESYKKDGQVDLSGIQARLAEALKPAPKPAAMAAASLDPSFTSAPLHLTASDGQAPVANRVSNVASGAGNATESGGEDARPKVETTPVGAERGANRDGSIPAWSGGLGREQWPAGYASGGRLVDPYASEKPLFTISNGNVERYRDHLAPGYLALLAKYPDYTLPVYASHRSVSYPQAILDASQANIGKAQLIGSDSLKGAHQGFPFPNPANGVQALWNHRVRYRGDSVQALTGLAVVSDKGIERTAKQTERVWFRYSNLRDPSDLSKDNILLYYLSWFNNSSGALDFLVLVHESANSIERPRSLWVIPGVLKSKMFRLPPMGYDQPFPDSDGLMFIDMLDMYNGAFDRYDWKLLGKRELYIPYNSYRLNDGRSKNAQILTAHHLNQSYARYELHRVWVVEASEREGASHQFGRRRYYLDEDSWNVVLVENQDRSGALWRFQEGHLLPDYDRHCANAAPSLIYDLKDGRYFASRLTQEEAPPKYDLGALSDADFLPEAVKQRYGQ